MAFGLPILSDLLRAKETKKSIKNKNIGLKALILTPTRELAFQIQKHLNQVLPEKLIGIMTLVGGMSKQKQTRLLSYCPEILIATPGRLWEFIESGDYEYLETLRTIEFLVLDEADKMIELGHFEELDKILGYVYQKQTGETEDDVLIEKMVGGKKPSFKTDALISEETINDIGIETPTELPNQYYFDEKTRTIQLRPIVKEEKKEISKKSKRVKDFVMMDKESIPHQKKLKTFLVSATLTKTFKSNSQRLQNNKYNEEKNKKNSDENPKLQSLVQKIKFASKKPKIIDLSQTHFMPEKLKAYKTLTSDEDKPIHLYNFLAEKFNEKTVIFTNTISVARRLATILHKSMRSKFPPLCLHSHLQQKQRLRKLDEFLTGKNQIIVCTDVAARGLDIPKIQNVIHYQIPRDVDTYVHRSGRTARIGSEGVVFSLVGPKEQKRFEKICEELGEEQENWKRTIKDNIRDIVMKACEETGKEMVVNKDKKQRSWFEKNARETDIDLDEGVKKMIYNGEESNWKEKGKEKKKGKGKKMVKVQRKTEERQFRRNGVYLDPGMIRDLMLKMGNN